MICWLYSDVFHGYTIACDVDPVITLDVVPDELVLRHRAAMDEFQAVNAELAKIYRKERVAA